MNTSATITTRPTTGSTLIGRVASHLGSTLIAWSTNIEQPRSREYLAELHQHRQQAQRLRDERHLLGTSTRML